MELNFTAVRVKAIYIRYIEAYTGKCLNIGRNALRSQYMIAINKLRVSPYPSI